MNRRLFSFSLPDSPSEHADDVPATRRRLLDSLILRRQYLHVAIMSLLPFIGTIIAVSECGLSLLELAEQLAYIVTSRTVRLKHLISYVC